MSQIAIIKTGGKQYKVKEGDVIKIEKLSQGTGSKVEFLDVLLVADESYIEIGKPIVSNAKVSGEILEQGRSKKIDVIKFKRKVRYKRKYGHRQPYTKVRIESIKTGS